jgi:peptidoglycan/LPS O-acetylase OafA/YrhL
MNRAPQAGFVPALEGVRGVAILLVVLVHAYLRPGGGFLGVDVFFVLSGFLITTLLLREQSRRGRISLRGFYRRRALRLVPALVVFLLAYVAVTALAMSTTAGTPWSPTSLLLWPVLESAFYVSNVAQAWGGLFPAGISQMWSLATEEQFYLLWPLTLVWLNRRRATPQKLARVLVTVIVLVAADRLLLDLLGVSRPHLYFAPETSFDTLLVGCLFGVWFVHGNGPRMLYSRSFRRLLWPVALAAAALHVHVLGDWNDPYLYKVVLPLFSLEVGFLVFVAATDERSLLARGVAIGPLRYLGRISYSLYLWHPLVLWVVRPALRSWFHNVHLTPTEAVALAIACAMLSYNLVELPFLRRKERLAAAQVVAEPTSAPEPLVALELATS